MIPLVVVGAGGFGREVLGIVEAVNSVSSTWHVVGVLDDAPSDADRRALVALGHDVTGPITDLATLRAHAVLGIGSPAVRAFVDSAYPAVDWAVLVHPDATVGTTTTLGPGTVIAPGARLSIAITGGRHLHVDQNATLGHDAVLGDHVRLNPQACVSGSVTVGDRTLIGASAVVLEGRRLGADVVVGAGAVVTRDVPAGYTVKGVPAR